MGVRSRWRGNRLVLKKPPLVEVWMSFRFEPVAGCPEWDRKRYETFLSTVATTHPNIEEMTRRALQLSTSKFGKTTRVQQQSDQLLAVRAISEDGLRVVQMKPDLLAVHYICSHSEPYPGFSKLLDEAISLSRRYADCYRSPGIVEAALHYVDTVEIPLPENRLLHSDDYFTIQFEAPEQTFGGLIALEIKAMMLPPDGKEPVELLFTADPVRQDEANRRFHLEWHSAAKTGGRMEEDCLRATLKDTHDRLEKCFRSAFTPKGWALLEPDDPS